MSGGTGCPRGCGIESHAPGAEKRMAPCPERIERLAGRVARQVALRRGRAAERRVGIVLFGFPPNAGAAGTAAWLDVFRSLFPGLKVVVKNVYELKRKPGEENVCVCALRGLCMGKGLFGAALYSYSEDTPEDTPRIHIRGYTFL